MGILMWLQHTFTEKRNHEIKGRACWLTCLQDVRFYRQKDRPKVYISFWKHCPNSSNKFLYFKQGKNQPNIVTQEVTPVEIGQTVAKVKLLIMASKTALTPIIYNSVYSDLIATQ